MFHEDFSLLLLGNALYVRNSKPTKGVNDLMVQELLDLGEAVRTRCRGLSQALIMLLPTSRYKAGRLLRKKSKER